MKECSRKQSLKNSKIEFLNYNKLLNLVSDLGCNNLYKYLWGSVKFHYVIVCTVHARLAASTPDAWLAMHVFCVHRWEKQPSGCFESRDYQITVAYIMFHCKIAEPELKGNL